MSEKAYHHGNLRFALIEAALDILDESGIDAVSIRQVAKRVGVAHSAPANHFKNKRALFTALAAEIFKQLAQKIKLKLSNTPNNLNDSIHLFASTIVNFGLAYPNRYKLVWRKDELNHDDQTLYEIMEVIYKQLGEILLTHSQQSDIDVESQVIALWSMIHGYVMLRLDGSLVAGRDEVSGAERQIAIIDVMLKGLNRT